MRVWLQGGVGGGVEGDDGFGVDLEGLGELAEEGEKEVVAADALSSLSVSLA